MDFDSKIKWSIFIFSIIICMSSGCVREYDGCYYDFYCSTEYVSFGNEDFSNDYSTCRNNNDNIYTNGNYYHPLRIKIVSDNAIEPLLRLLNENYYKYITVSLQIVDTRLATAPVFIEFTHLKMLNLSNNNLNVAKLFNAVELSVLENIDLSHNFINSIQVDEDQYVYKSLRHLNLSYNLLKNIPGRSFDLFKSLQYLDLSHNNIFTIDHYSFEGLTYLKYLYLSYNNISEINASLFRFSYLEELLLDNNNIQNLASKDLDSLKSLRILNLDYNNISSIQKDVFSKTESLVTLQLHHNIISYIHKDAFLSSSGLKVVDLSNNLITNLPKDLFVNKNITLFTITGNILEGAISKGTFDGLQLITKLDVSHQEIATIEEFAFFGLTKLITLLLNDNKIRTISKQSFNTLICLKQLDLTNNLIVAIDFNKEDLINLQMFSVSKNYITQILYKDLQGFSRLKFLDMSNNNISEIEITSFQQMTTVEDLEILNNPIKGALLNNTFIGLCLIPSLDLSNTSITSIQNGSFTSMIQLQELNISYSSVNRLEYRAFMNTGNIKLIDLSFNKLTIFYVNGSDLQSLTSLYLNNNEIFRITNNFFMHMTFLSRIILSYNFIKTIESECFADQTELLYLDVSYNNKLTFNSFAISNTRTLNTLLLSGIKNVTDFTHLRTIPLRRLELSHLGICNISSLHLNSMRHLTRLDMSNNNISNIEMSAFKNMIALEQLDLSFNNISFIQPSSFKDNVFLVHLNLSHNLLTSINYGIFRGLISLNLLDVSYNTLHDVGREKFYDTPNLQILIADYNRITDISNDLSDMKLDLLSIGHNPLSCEKVISLKQLGYFNVSAVNKDEINGENIEGVACNRISYNKTPEPEITVNKLGTNLNERTLLDIRDILLNSSERRASKMFSDSGAKLLTDTFNSIDKYNANQTVQLKDIKSEIVQVRNIKSEAVEELARTNSFLERILKVMVGFESLQNRHISNSVNSTSYDKKNISSVVNTSYIGNNSILETLVSDVNQLKLELLYIENVISEIDRKISKGRTLYTSSEKNNTTDYESVVNKNIGKSFIFLEICTSLILFMLICYLLYKFYEVKILQHTRSLSTRNLSDVMNISNL